MFFVLYNNNMLHSAGYTVTVSLTISKQIVQFTEELEKSAIPVCMVEFRTTQQIL